MKNTIYFKTEEEKNNYFPNGVPNNVLAIVQPNAESGAVLFTSSNNGPMRGITAPQGGYITNPADEARITYIESYFATQEYVDDAIANAAVGGEVDLSNYALKSELPSLNGYATESYVSSEIGKISIPSLDGYATQTWVENQDYLTQHQDISEKADKSELASYVSKTELSSCGYLTTHQDLSNYALKSELPTVPSLEGYATESYVISKIEDVVGAAPAALDTLKEIGDSLNNDSNFAGTMTSALASKANASDVYTKTEIDNAGFLTAHQSLSGLATEQYVNNAISNIPATDLSAYVSKTELSAAGYLTSHQSLADYATKAEISAAGYLTSHQDISGLVSKTELSSLGYITANDIPSTAPIDENLVPKTNNYYSLGTDVKKYKNLYLSGSSYSDINYISNFELSVLNSNFLAFKKGGQGILSIGGVSQNMIAPWTNNSVNLGDASVGWKNLYTYNIFLAGTNITSMFPSYSYVDTKIGSIETALDSILGNS